MNFKIVLILLIIYLLLKYFYTINETFNNNSSTSFNSSIDNYILEQIQLSKKNNINSHNSYVVDKNDNISIRIYTYRYINRHYIELLIYILRNMEKKYNNGKLNDKKIFTDYHFNTVKFKSIPIIKSLINEINIYINYTIKDLSDIFNYNFINNK